MIGLAMAVALSGLGGGFARAQGPPVRSRVVMAEDAQATSAFEPKPDIVRVMV